MFDAIQAFLSTFLFDWLAILTTLVIQTVVVVLPIMLVVAWLTYAERKVIGFMQVRMGPNRVGSFGLLQPIADALKLIMKEIVLPAQSNIYLFVIAPVLAIAPAVAAWAVIPFDNGVVVADIDAGVLYVLSIASIVVYGIVVSGWHLTLSMLSLGHSVLRHKKFPMKLRWDLPWLPY